MFTAQADRRALTPRERDIALLLAQGCQLAQVALALGISERIAERHVSAISAKLGVRPKVRRRRPVCTGSLRASSRFAGSPRSRWTWD